MEKLKKLKKLLEIVERLNRTDEYRDYKDKHVLAINKLLLQYLQNAVEVCNAYQQDGANESFINLTAKMLLENYYELAKNIEIGLCVIPIEVISNEVID